MEALSNLLGNSKYITGDKPCPEDCAVFAVLDIYLNSKVIGSDPLRDMVMKYENLTTYVGNIQKELYPSDNPSKFRVHPL